MLEDVKASLEKLIAAYENVKAENSDLKEEIGQLRAREEDYRKQIAELEKKIDNLKLSGAFTGDASGRKDAKESIDRLIREINRCISLMEG